MKFEIWYVSQDDSTRDERYLASEERMIDPQTYEKVDAWRTDEPEDGPESMLDEVFRRMNPPSHLEKTRSLSVGDLVVSREDDDWTTWMCVRAGWREIDFDPAAASDYFMVHWHADAYGYSIARKSDGVVLASTTVADGVPVESDIAPSFEKFDVGEYREYYDGLDVPNEVDIEDIGFFTEDGDYVAPRPSRRQMGRP